MCYYYMADNQRRRSSATHVRDVPSKLLLERRIFAHAFYTALIIQYDMERIRFDFNWPLARAPKMNDLGIKFNHF